MVFICGSCNREFETREKLEQHWQDIGLTKKSQRDKDKEEAERRRRW